VVIDRLTKVAHFIPMKQTSSAADLVPLYIKEVLVYQGGGKVAWCAEVYRVRSRF
jgi:hypothetical protein